MSSQQERREPATVERPSGMVCVIHVESALFSIPSLGPELPRSEERRLPLPESPLEQQFVHSRRDKSLPLNFPSDRSYLPTEGGKPLLQIVLGDGSLEKQKAKGGRNGEGKTGLYRAEPYEYS